MEQFETEEQQIEAIKKFWRENGLAIVIGAAVGLGGLWGWRAYSDNQELAKEASSDAYQVAMDSLAEDETKLGDAKDFIAENPDSGYAVLAALQVAKAAVDRQDYAEASAQLQWVTTHTDDETVQAIALLRLARIQLQQEKTQEALATLDKVSSDAFVGLRKEIEGDVYVATGNTSKAKAAYLAALEDNQTNNLLQIKIENLPVLTNKAEG